MPAVPLSFGCWRSGGRGLSSRSMRFMRQTVQSSRSWQPGLVFAGLASAVSDLLNEGVPRSFAELTESTPMPRESSAPLPKLSAAQARDSTRTWLKWLRRGPVAIPS